MHAWVDVRRPGAMADPQSRGDVQDVTLSFSFATKAAAEILPLDKMRDVMDSLPDSRLTIECHERGGDEHVRSDRADTPDDDDDDPSSSIPGSFPQDEIEGPNHPAYGPGEMPHIPTSVGRGYPLPYRIGRAGARGRRRGIWHGGEP